MTLEEAFYELRFENAFLQAKAQAFQDFFDKLMSLAYKADFMACRPWGQQGDHKNDGFLKSERRLFQVYAPNEMKAANAILKIRADFEGAKGHWNKDFDTWVFVHNAVDGLPPHVHKVLLDFETENPGISLESWGLEELRIVFRRLSLQDMESWFGHAPTTETKASLGFKDLQEVLERLADQPVPSGQSVQDVPSGKIEANALSESVAELLKAGMSKAPLVEDFFDKWHDPALGEQIANSFREKYKSLRENFTANQKFTELQTWAGGTEHTTPEHELAVLTVLAYYFERCDIFEEPKDEQA